MGILHAQTGHMCLDWGSSLQPRCVPDWESNPHFSHRMTLQATEPHSPGAIFNFIQPENCCFPWVSQSTAMANRKCLLTRSLLNQMAMTSVHMVMTSKFLSPVPDQLFLSCRGVFPNMLGSSLKALWNELVLPSLIHSQISSSFQ